MNHVELVERTKDAINTVFSDQSVPQSTTRESLKDLKDEIDILLYTL